MPYIREDKGVPSADRAILNPLIDALKSRIDDYRAFSGKSRHDAELAALRVSALRLFELTALNASEQYMEGNRRGLRYWTSVGFEVATHVAREMHDRVLRGDDPNDSRYMAERFEYAPLEARRLVYLSLEDANRFHVGVDALVAAIAKLGGPEGYKYDAAYFGLVNYTLTTLSLKILLGQRDRNGRIEKEAVRLMIRFWLAMAAELYETFTRPYENQQIEKSGDVPEYKELRKAIY